MREALRGALLSVLFFGLLTFGMPVSVVAQNTSPDGSTRCDNNGNCATDALVNVVAARFPFVINILGGNPLGDLGGIGPEINIVTPDIEQMISDYAQRQLDKLGGTARNVCQAIQSDGETANAIKIAGYTLALVLALARMATQLNPSQNEDVKSILDTALVAIVAGGGIYAILDLTCRNLQSNGLI